MALGFSLKPPSQPYHLHFHMPQPMFVFSVYLPSLSGCTDVYRESLDRLNATLTSLPVISNTIILGDFNADPGCHGGPYCTTRLIEQGSILAHFLDQWNLASTHLHFPGAPSSHTFESEAHLTLSAIDHIMCHTSILPRFKFSNTLPEHHLNRSNYLPVVAVVQVHHLPQPP